MKNLNINQICGKMIKDARIAKNISIEEVALYFLPVKEENINEENHELEEYKGAELEHKIEANYLRRQVFENAELEKKYQDYIKKIKYWEKGNGFPELNEIYKLAEIIDIDPNEIYKYRELGRKGLKGEQQISKWKYYRNNFIDRNLESLKILFPALIFAVLFYLFLSKSGASLIENIKIFFRQNLAGMK